MSVFGFRADAGAGKYYAVVTFNFPYEMSIKVKFDL